jgi:hypothetical protein
MKSTICVQGISFVEQASELLPGVALYNTDDISKNGDFLTQL